MELSPYNWGQLYVVCSAIKSCIMDTKVFLNIEMVATLELLPAEKFTTDDITLVSITTLMHYY